MTSANEQRELDDDGEILSDEEFNEIFAVRADDDDEPIAGEKGERSDVTT